MTLHKHIPRTKKMDYSELKEALAKALYQAVKSQALESGYDDFEECFDDLLRDEFLDIEQLVFIHKAEESKK